ncbi:uncharacterized protein BDZ99DRAFT_576208 [Mytilinidion resinicola]|uniref:Yeast cell wall synthesis Kre9/Knh1-like N-terminal domain-containing protein n=1 Tax=Mytilinidion resinicola TaxID=574789 RepID=A0A6A6Y3R9_9PEZI|nr:uncharacterized protein BDZ99DRAFT_576208 [Mytilinidion resinicola]KAF2803300.1 hypothetical protein BDZ99DRAFT_576208 [Mytilinidion resinicola]
MHFPRRYLASKLFLGFVFLWSYATTCSATLAFTKYPSTIAAGSSTELSWTSDDSSTPVSINLMKGPENDLTNVMTITASAKSVSLAWTVPSSLDPGSDYILQLDQGDNVNYSGQFEITGGTVASTAAPAASSVAATVATTPVAKSSSTPEPSSTAALSTVAQASSTASSENTHASSGLSSTSSAAVSSSASVASTPSTNASPTSTSASSASSHSPTSTTSSTTTSRAASTGLTAGAKAGIGVAVPLGVIAIALGAFFLGRRRNTTKPTPSDEEGYTARHELDGKGVPPTELPVAQWDERGGYWRTQPTASAAELPTRDNKHELAAREVGR